MASKGFEFIQGNERLDWGVLVAIDVERLMSSSKSGDPISTGANIDTLQRIVENIAFSRITHDEAKLFTADHVLHLFQLAQFVIQYLVYCQDTLATMNLRLSSRTEENERRLSRLEEQRHALESDNAKLRKDVKSMRRTIIAYENTQHLLENNYKYQNRYPRRYHSNPHMPARRMEPFCHTSHQRRRSNMTHPNAYYTTDDYDAHYDSETEYDDTGYIQGVRHTRTTQNGNINHHNYYNNKVNKLTKQRTSDRQHSREEPTMQYICQWCGDGYHKIESLQSHLRKRHASRVLDSNVTEDNNVEHKATSTQPLPPQMQENVKNYKDGKVKDRHLPHSQYSFEQENERQKREEYQNNYNKDDDDDDGEGKKTSKQLERLEEELNRMKDELHKSKLMEMEKREQLLLSLLQQKSADRVEVETRKPITITPAATIAHNNYESDNKVTTLAEPVVPPLALPGLPSPNTYLQSQEAPKQFHTNHKHQHQQEQPYKENKQHEMANSTQFVTSPERHSLVQTATTATDTATRGGVTNNYNTNEGKEKSAKINFADSTENRIQSIPVMPDIEAASAYNTTRAHELTNNALMRQMLELQDEIKALKIGTTDEHTHSAMPVNKVESVQPLHVTLPVPHYTVPPPAGPSSTFTPTLTTPTSSSIAPAQRTEQVQEDDREAVNLAKYGPPGPSFVPPEILSRRSLSLSGSANKMRESSPPQTATAAAAATTTIQQPEEQQLKHQDKQETALHHHNHREHEHHTHRHTHRNEEEKEKICEQENLLQHTERSTEPNTSTKALQSSLVVPSGNILPTPVPVLPTNIPTSAGQIEHQHKLGSSNADNKMIAIKKISDTGNHNKKNKNALLSTSSSTLSSTGTSYSSSSSSYSTSPSQTSSTSLSKSTMPPSSVQPTSLSIPAAPSTITAIPVPIPTINNNNNFFQPALPQEPKIQQSELLQHSEHAQQSEKLKQEEAKQKEEHHHHKHKREQEKQEQQRKTSTIPIPVPINPTVATTGISSNGIGKTNLSSVPAVTPSPYATASYMTGIASNNTVGSKLDHNNSHFSVALPAKDNQSDKKKPSTTANNGSSMNNKQGLLAALKITPPPASHSSSLSSSSYSASSSGSSSSGSYSYSSSGSYSSSIETSSTSKDKVQTINKTSADNRNNIVASNTYLDKNKGNEQYSSSSSYSYEQKSS